MSRIVDPKFVKIIYTSFLYASYKGLPSINNIFYVFVIFLVCFIFITWVCGACMNPRNFSLFVHSLVC